MVHSKGTAIFQLLPMITCSYKCETTLFVHDGIFSNAKFVAVFNVLCIQHALSSLQAVSHARAQVGEL